MSAEVSFEKENLDFYLKEVAKEYRKLSGKNMPAEIIMVGGAAILARYGFRDVTYDIDAIISASSAMKDAIKTVADKYKLPSGWLNEDFRRTDSFSQKLVVHSTKYRTFSNIVDIRYIEAEYLVAMKLKSGRIYKKDLSDVIGILYEHMASGSPLTYEKINAAVINLYGSWDGIKDLAKQTLNSALSISNADDLLLLYNELQDEEAINKKTAINVQNYEGISAVDNVDEVIMLARARYHNQGSRNKTTKDEPEK